MSGHVKTQFSVPGSLEAVEPLAATARAKPARTNGNGHRSSQAVPAPVISVIVPSRHEAESLPVLLDRLAGLELGQPVEIVVVDDSDDDTAEVAERARGALERPDCQIRVMHRTGPERQGGLSGAVVDGIRATTGRWICVMDADLQHPPEVIPEMLDRAIGDDRDLVVASRYCDDGSSAGLNGMSRRLVSRAATATARWVMPRGMHELSDPMSGFFVVDRDRIDVDRLHPRGFKILLEITGRHPELRIGDHPFRFAPRHAGHSKASVSQAAHLARQLRDLRQSAADSSPPLYLYDIHGLMCVDSDRFLPELEKFTVDAVRPGPTIRVRVDRLTGHPRGENIDLTGARPTVSYVERMGFGVRVEMDGPDIDVTVSPFVARSPHVLYTNVVEPLLRWHLVGRGYALVHAACVSDGAAAYLVTARTDTGKTTTMLKILDGAPLRFLSDDLVVVHRNGTVLTYPKPLTISAHTVHALKDTDLTRLERLALVPQSRVHSREGREFAFLLTRYRLPVASISALIQRIIPPPKYHIERLVPGVRSGRSAQVRSMFVIERGGTGSEPVDPQQALEILFANCQDAFGFPPYETLERMLLAVSPDDLRTAERAIITDALDGVSTEILRSETLDWAERIADRITDRARVSLSLAELDGGGLSPGMP